MKKFFACLVAVLLVLPLEAGALAAGNEFEADISSGTIVPRETPITGSGTFEAQTAEMTVSFDITESYEVTIPASIKLSGSLGDGFSGSAPITAAPQLGSGQLIVSLSSVSLTNPEYYVNGSKETVFNGGTPFSEVRFTPSIFSGEDNTGKPASVKLTADSGLYALSQNAANGVYVLLTTGTDKVTNTLTYSVTGVGGLSSGSYSFPQTFSIVVSKPLS